jgi:hypothetical protein
MRCAERNAKEKNKQTLPLLACLMGKKLAQGRKRCPADPACGNDRSRRENRELDTCDGGCTSSLTALFDLNRGLQTVVDNTRMRKYLAMGLN